MKKQVQILTACACFSLLFLALPSYFKQSVLLQRVDYGLQDILFKIRRTTDGPLKQVNDLAVVAIDSESCEKLNRRWPWSRVVFARLIDSLREQGAAVIAMNFSFNGLEDGEESTRELARAIREHGRVIVGASLDKQRLLKPHTLLLEAGAQYGIVEKILDEDYAIRRSYLAIVFRAATRYWEYSLPLRVLIAAQGESAVLSTEEILRRWAAKDGRYRINFLAAESDFKTIPAWAVLEKKLAGRSLKGKTVFVGITSSLLSESSATTPLGVMPGVMVHANEVLAMNVGRRLREAPEGLVYPLSWLISLALLVLLMKRFWTGLVALPVFLVIVFLAAQVALSHDWIVHPAAWLGGPFLALLIGIAAELIILFLENRGLLKITLHDKMTGLYTVDYLRLRLEEEWKQCARTEQPVSVVMTDLDRFKQINDTLGHEMGNTMILKTATVLRESAREVDIVSRYGGDEFMVLLWHSSAADADTYRARLRKMYADMAAALPEPRLQDSSISIGVATYDPKRSGDSPKSPQELIEAADKDLFRDKESRRRR